MPIVFGVLSTVTVKHESRLAWSPSVCRVRSLFSSLVMDLSIEDIKVLLMLPMFRTLFAWIDASHLSSDVVFVMSSMH